MCAETIRTGFITEFLSLRFTQDRILRHSIFLGLRVGKVA